jgi:hypothetical protein
MFELQTPTPIIVKLIEPSKAPTGIADVILGAIGLSGAIALVAVLFGALLASVMFWVRRRQL